MLGDPPVQKNETIRRARALALACLATLAFANCRMTENTNTNATRQNENERAAAVNNNDSGADNDIHRRAIIIDMHADTVQFIIDEGADINAGAPRLHLDAPRMREGGLDAQFFSIWVEPQYYGAGGEVAVRRADEQIAAIRALAEKHPETWALATTAAEVRAAARDGRLSALLGLEGGYALDGKIEAVEKYYRAGVRYMSPTWSVSLAWAGSSGDAAGKERGLNDFGRRVISEMNRLGIMVDVSHVSDKTFWDIIDVSQKPVIATHSNARSIAPHPRNLTDDMIRAIARTGGVVCVVFYPAFVEPGWDEKKLKVDAEIASAVTAAGDAAKGRGSSKRMARDRVREREYAERLPSITVARVVDHIDHIVRLVGVDHVGMGSDFDGIQALPRDMRSVADLPNLTAELLRRGYKEDEIEKILGGNILRVFEQVEAK